MFCKENSKAAIDFPLKFSPCQVHNVLNKHMLTDGFDFVIDLKKSHGSYIYDSLTDKILLDYFTFFASSAIGFNHPGLTTPEFIEKLGKLAVNKPSNSDAYTVEMAEFVETFSLIARPSYFSYLFFVDGGTLANENALKAAFDWKVRKNFRKGYNREVGTQVIHFKNAFHGRSGYTLSLTNTDPVKINYFPKFQWPRINNPVISFPINKVHLEQVMGEEIIAINQVKQAIKDNPDDIAALIIEPIQGEGGDNFFRKEFLEQLRLLCDENDIMLIFDEIQTGIGITGKMWAHEYYVKPDMLTFGKKTHVCGFMCSRRIDEEPDNVFHTPSRINSTFGGNLIDMARATKILEIIEEEKLVENALLVGNSLHNQLDELESEFPELVSNSRGLGLFCAIDINTKENRDKLRQKAVEKGLVLLGCSEKTIRFRPPLNLSFNEAEEGIDIIKRCLNEIRR
jgi:L-lysine 6-transaminase